MHGALAALFVHAGGIEASVDALRGAVEQVGALPRARCFHLLLDEKGPHAIAELCERLALFDDRNVARGLPGESAQRGARAARAARALAALDCSVARRPQRARSG